MNPGFLGLILAAIVFYTPLQLHMPVPTGIPGVNVLNLLFLAALLGLQTKPAAVPGQLAPMPAAPTPLKGNFLLWFAGLGIALLISLFRGGAPPGEDITEYKNAIFFPLYFFLFYHGVRDLDTARIVYFAIMAIAALTMLQAVRQGLDYGLANFNEMKRAAGPFSSDWTNSNRAGVFFAMFTPAFAAFALYIRGRYAWLKWFAAGAAAVGVFATFVTYSRQAYFILGLSMLVLFIRRSPVWVMLAVVALLNVQFWAPEAVVERVEMTQQEDEETGEVVLEESAESRLIIWEAAGKMILDHPEGVGLMRFRKTIPQYLDTLGIDAHNAYVLTAAEANVITAVVMLVLLLRLGGLAFPLLRNPDAEAQVLGWTLLMCAIGAILGNMYGSFVYFGAAMGNVWALAGLAARATQLYAAGASPVGAAAPLVSGPAPALATGRRTL
ncbi:MAG: hypothetical protein RL026_353 [Pseudomonadota bacterium]